MAAARRAMTLQRVMLVALCGSCWCPGAGHAQDGRIDAAWETVQFDRKGLAEVIELVQTHHVLPAVPTRAWASAVAGSLKTLTPPLELWPRNLMARMAADPATAPLVAGAQVTFPGCGASLQRAAVLLPAPSAAAAPTSVEELRARRQARREVQRTVQRAWEQLPFGQSDMNCLLDAAAQRLADEPTPTTAGGEADPRWRERAQSRFWRQAGSHFLAAMDAHGSLIPTAVFEELEKESSGQQVVDVGLIAGREGAEVRVQRAERGGPAADAGIKKGDTLLEIDGQPVSQWGGWQLMQALQGKAGTSVEVVVQSGAAAKRHVKLTRRALQHPATVGVAGGEGTGVAVVRVPALASGVAAAVPGALADVQTESGRPVSSVVLDMRGNTGGWVKEAVAFADLFLSAGVIAAQNYRDGPPDTFSAARQPGDLALPLVVLVDAECRSACELVAAALQDHDRSVTVGQRTYGKGSVQAVIDAKRGPWSVLVTIATYSGPRGRSIQGAGVEPELTLPAAASQVVASREADLPTALTPTQQVVPHRSTLATPALLGCTEARRAAAAPWRDKLRRQDAGLLAAIDAATCLAEPVAK